MNIRRTNQVLERADNPLPARILLVHITFKVRITPPMYGQKYLSMQGLTWSGMPGGPVVILCIADKSIEVIDGNQG